MKNCVNKKLGEWWRADQIRGRGLCFQSGAQEQEQTQHGYFVTEPELRFTGPGSSKRAISWTLYGAAGMPLLPNHPPGRRTKGLPAPPVRPPRNSHGSLLHMPRLHSHLYIQQRNIPSTLYRSPQPSVRVNYDVYGDSHPHSHTTSFATLPIYWTNTKARIMLPSRRTEQRITLRQLPGRILVKQKGTLPRSPKWTDQTQPTGLNAPNGRKTERRLHNNRGKI